MTTLAVGWFGHLNLGDEAFKPALEKILGDVEFTDRVPANVNDYAALVFGGGSFLDQKLNAHPDAFPIIPIGFLGVGWHGSTHASWYPLLDRSAITITRNECSDADYQAKDLVFARQPPLVTKIRQDKLLILPNGYTVDDCDAYLATMHTHITAVLDQGWQVELQPMLTDGSDHDDRRIIDKLAHLDVHAGDVPLSESQLVGCIDSSSLVISSRFHGCVFSTWLGTPFVGVSNHDKMRSFFSDAGWRNYADHYKLKVETLQAAAAASPSPDQMHKYTTEGLERWRVLTPIIRERLLL